MFYAIFYCLWPVRYYILLKMKCSILYCIVYTRHLVYAPSTFDSYSGINFPGIADTIYTAQRSNSTEDWNAVAQQMAALTYSIHAAGNFLHDAINFLSPSSVSQKLPN